MIQGNTKTAVSYPFEIHLTVSIDSLVEQARFIDVCNEMDVKAIVVGLTEEHKDVMTSSRIKTTYCRAMVSAKSLATELTKQGFNVIRIKLETIPQYLESDIVLEDTYYEGHLQIKVNPNTDYDLLNDICSMYKAHRSRNLFKGTADSGIQMVTLRGYETRSAFLQEITLLSSLLYERFGSVDKTELEYVIYDSNKSHDDRAWGVK